MKSITTSHVAFMPLADEWPVLDYGQWSETLETLHLWTQIAGKIRLATTPWTNHAWHVPLYPTPRGLTTSAMYQGPRQLDMEFDFREHLLVIRASDGQHRAVTLRPRTVADFYAEVMHHLDSLGFLVRINEVPSEIVDPIRFSDDTVHSHYDADAATGFSQALNQSARVFSEFRARFIGKCSPVHFFWGSFDLAVTRFSGRRAPVHPGGVPGLPDWITREAYSHEVYSCGFWPGSAASPAAAYYAYAYPTANGLGQSSVMPSEAFWSNDMGEFFLPYDAVRGSADPDATLMQFLQSTYESVAELSHWDRVALETQPGFPRESSPQTQ